MPLEKPTLVDCLKAASIDDEESLRKLFRELLHRGYGETPTSYHFADLYVICGEFGTIDDKVYLSEKLAQELSEEENKARKKPRYGVKAPPSTVKDLEDYIGDQREEAEMGGHEMALEMPSYDDYYDKD